MEIIISLYDKTMHTRWKNVKNTDTPVVLQNLLSDVMVNKQFDYYWKSDFYFQ